MGKKLDLTKVKGVGERMAQKIVQQLGGEQELINAVENFEIDRISSIEGVSQRKAIEIINDLSGNSTEEFLKTERALQLYEEILEKILSYAHSSHAKNKILLLSPMQDPEKIKSSIDFVMEAKNNVSALPIKHVRGLLNNLSLPQEVKPNYDPSVAILVESSEDYGYLVDLGLNRHFPIISAQESGEIQEYEFVIYVYSHGNLALDEQENVVMVSKDSEILEIIPESVLNYFTHNKSILTQVLELRTLLQKETVLDETIEILNELEELKYKEVDFDKSVNSAKKQADEEIKSSVKNVDLKGDEVLALLNQGMTGKIEKIFDEVISKARADIKLETGTEFDPFLRTYPLEIDDAELERVKKQDQSKRQIEIFDKKVTAAKRLSQIRKKVDQEIKEALEFDYQFAMGCFAHYYQLKAPELGDAFHLEGALHLNLAHKNENESESHDSYEDIQRINYSLFYPENVALLTGANSGGKTTLLETLAQISIMTHMGLPVCAEKAEVKLLDEVYFFSKQRSLDAGAFESFLRTFMPIVTTDNQKLILLDELEAITELEAAVKIISSFIELINDSNSFAVIVTHMAREIIKYAPIRVDGIEAKGLDDNYNLLVDRTPKMNYLARSTPELILKMIYERSDGKLKDIYGKILEKF